MGGRTFGLLKTGRLQPKSTKRAEIRLAILLKMLQIAHFGTAALVNDENDIRWLYGPLFPRNMANHSELFPLLPTSQF